MAFDSNNILYVVDGGNYRIQKFNTDGVYQSQFGTFGSGNYQFVDPDDIAIDNNDNLYVADEANNRIQVFGSSSTCTLPVSGTWTVSSSCAISTNSVAPADVIIQNGALLTIPNGITLTIHFATNHLLIQSGGGVLIKAGGAIN